MLNLQDGMYTPVHRFSRLKFAYLINSSANIFVNFYVNSPTVLYSVIGHKNIHTCIAALLNGSKYDVAY